MKTTNLRFAQDDAQESIIERKKRLRAYMKERRRDNENRDVKENWLVENFFEGIRVLQEQGILKEFQSAFVYLSFSSEAPTDKLVQRLEENGVRVYAPVLKNGEMFAVEHQEDFTLSDYGIREPVGEPFHGDCDVAIVPLLAADEKGGRLGYGGGYYDKYLRAHACTIRIGYAFDFQILPTVPTEENDEKLQMLVTDKRLRII